MSDVYLPHDHWMEQLDCILASLILAHHIQQQMQLWKRCLITKVHGYQKYTEYIYHATMHIVVFRVQFQLKCTSSLAGNSLQFAQTHPEWLCLVVLHWLWMFTSPSPPTGQGVHPWCDQAPVWETPSLSLPQRHPRREKGRMKLMYVRVYPL